MRRVRNGMFIMVLCLCVVLAGHAQQSPGGQGTESPQTDSPRPKVVPVVGPKNVALGGQEANLNLPQGYIFLNGIDARKLLERSGEPEKRGLVGLVSDKDPALDWDALLSYDARGYVSDAEADKLDADGLLESYRQNTEAANEERKSRGLKAIDVVGWFRKPMYNRAEHALTWSIIGKEEGTGVQVVNQVSVILGRHGTLTCTVIGDPKDAKLLQTKMDTLTTRLTFPQGKDYASYRQGDKKSEWTMAGLITGGSAIAYGAAKVGLFAKFGKLLLIALVAMKKAAILIIAAIAGFFRKVSAKLKGKKESVVAASGSGPEPPTA